MWGARAGEGAGGDSSPGRGVRSISRWQWGTDSSSKLCTCNRARGDALEERSRGRWGFLCCLGVKPRPGTPGRCQAEIPQGATGTGTLGYQWGMAPTGRFPYLGGDGRTGRARRGAGEMPAMTYWQTAKILSRDSHHSSLGSVVLGCLWSDSHLEQALGAPGRRPGTGLCPSCFLLQQGTVGAQGPPWMDVLFTNNHLKVFQLTELNPEPTGSAGSRASLDITVSRASSPPGSLPALQ